MEGTATDGIELNNGVGMCPGGGFWKDANVTMEDCEFDLVGLPGRIWNVVDDGAGDGAAGGGKAGDTFDSPGEAAVGVVRGVLALGKGAGSVVEIIG